jgi:hypothetical protein
MIKFKRRIFRISKSHVMTLPPEWVNKLTSPEVFVVFDKILLAIPVDDAQILEDAIERATEQVIAEVVSKT